jgi:hypothetical protein
VIRRTYGGEKVWGIVRYGERWVFRYRVVEMEVDTRSMWAMDLSIQEPRKLILWSSSSKWWGRDMFTWREMARNLDAKVTLDVWFGE